MTSLQFVVCPSCRVREVLSPGPNFSYLDMWVQTSRRHQDQGCKRYNWAHWGFDALWDSREPRILKSDVKMRLVNHPDGYHCLVPASWDAERIEMHFAMTRQRRGRR